MMAHDVPETRNHMGRIELPVYMEFAGSAKGWGCEIVCWHITPRKNVPSILEKGLVPSTCEKHISSGKQRPSAVYMFCARSVVEKNISALFDEDVCILQITIPSTHTRNIYPDNIYNMSVDVSMMAAIQYRDSIPPSWITEVKE